MAGMLSIQKVDTTQNNLTKLEASHAEDDKSKQKNTNVETVNNIENINVVDMEKWHNKEFLSYERKC